VVVALLALAIVLELLTQAPNSNPLSASATKLTTEPAGKRKIPSPGVVTVPPMALEILMVYCAVKPGWQPIIPTTKKATISRKTVALFTRITPTMLLYHVRGIVNRLQYPRYIIDLRSNRSFHRTIQQYFGLIDKFTFTIFLFLQEGITMIYIANYGHVSSVTRSSRANLSLYLPVLMARSVSNSLS